MVMFGYVDDVDMLLVLHDLGASTDIDFNLLPTFSLLKILLKVSRVRFDFLNWYYRVHTLSSATIFIQEFSWFFGSSA